jgi:hypothetical protein
LYSFVFQTDEIISKAMKQNKLEKMI